MPSILLYEFLASGGRLLGADGPEGAALCREGAAMLAALAAEFAAVEDCQTTVLIGSRWRGPPPAGCRVVNVADGGDDCAALAAEAARADWTVVIAPEFDGLLQSRCELVERCGGRLLGPSSQFVALAADKQRTAEYLAAAGVLVARGLAVDPRHPLPGEIPFAFPAVLKPRDGAGSRDICLVADLAAAERARVALGRPGRLERFHPGQPASVAVLCGPTGRWPLLPCSQRLSHDGRFHYLGGVCPIELQLSDRATRLAVSAIAALPAALGYIGVDLVLGDDPTGADDVVIEINPRLTTSYVGLRQAIEENLAAAMLQATNGATPAITWNGRAIEFDADGAVRHSAVSALPSAADSTKN